jgi:translation initiation factor 2 subunit 2
MIDNKDMIDNKVEEADAELNAELSDAFVNKKKKKKIKKPDVKIKPNVEIKPEVKINNFTPYSYHELIRRVYDELSDETLPSIQKWSLKMPIVHRINSKKTGWINFTDCSKCMNRESSHLRNFVLSELSVEGNINGNGYLLLNGAYTQKNIETILKKYVVAYVQCMMCKSLNTQIRKDESSRIQFLACLSCTSTKSVPPIKPGYKK